MVMVLVILGVVYGDDDCEGDGDCEGDDDGENAEDECSACASSARDEAALSRGPARGGRARVLAPPHRPARGLHLACAIDAIPRPTDVTQ
eukprot:541756-Pleurochrysis_carterae.AAC.1